MSYTQGSGTAQQSEPTHHFHFSRFDSNSSCLLTLNTTIMDSTHPCRAYHCLPDSTTCIKSSSILTTGHIRYGQLHPRCASTGTLITRIDGVTPYPSSNTLTRSRRLLSSATAFITSSRFLLKYPPVTGEPHMHPIFHFPISRISQSAGVSFVEDSRQALLRFKVTDQLPSRRGFHDDIKTM